MTNTTPQFAPTPISPLVGIVTFLTEVELSRGEPDVFVAAAHGPDMSVLGYPTGASIVGSGAGLTWEAARGAAVGECLERYSSAIVDAEDLVVGSPASLMRAGRYTHSPSDWSLFEPTQDVPYPAFTNDLSIAWSEGFDLVTGEAVLLPACFTYLSSSPALKESAATVIGPSVSTGCACARTIDEAMLGGLCELVERDAFMIAWRNRLPLPKVIIDSGCSLYDVYARRFRRPGLEYRIWQTTLDFTLPSFFGMLIDRRGATPRMVVGGACHPDAARAVQKTLCELIQGLTWLDYMGTNADSMPSTFDDIRTFTDRAVLYAANWMPDAFSFLMHDREPVSLSSIRSTRAPARHILDGLVAKMAAKGLRPAAIDLTTADVGECGYVVVRVVVPGLETMDGDHRLQMLGGRRWRRVPMDLGYLESPTELSDINPYPHPYP